MKPIVIPAHTARLFWAKVDKSGDCWLWTAFKNQQGYGRIKVLHRPILAHRLAWQLTYGVIKDDELCVCHHCDVRLCVRPDHLFLGTLRDNNLDRTRKGRTRSGTASGAKRGFYLEPPIVQRPVDQTIRATHNETRRGSQLSVEHGVTMDVMDWMRHR